MQMEKSKARALIVDAAIADTATLPVAQDARDALREYANRIIAQVFAKATDSSKLFGGIITEKYIVSAFKTHDLAYKPGVPVALSAYPVPISTGVAK